MNDMSYYFFVSYQNDNLHRVNRLCFNRTSSRGIPKESVYEPLTQLVIIRALKDTAIEKHRMTFKKIVKVFY